MAIEKGILVLIKKGEFKGELGCIHKIEGNLVHVNVEAVNQIVKYKRNEVESLCTK